jgi:hypothetical protein
MEVYLFKSWDAIMKKANGSCPERVNKEQFLKFVTEGGVGADAASVETVYNRMPAREFSVQINGKGRPLTLLYKGILDIQDV